MDINNSSIIPSQNIDTDASVDIEQQAGNAFDATNTGVNDHLIRRLFRRVTSIRNVCEPLGMYTRTTLQTVPLQTIALDTRDIHAEAIQKLFGLSDVDIARWPGLLTFCRNLERNFQQLLHPDFDVIWTIINRNHESSRRASDCWDWCFAVVEVFRKEPNGDPSLQRAYETLIMEAQMETHGISRKDKKHVLKAMFAVLCWVTGCLTPIINDEMTPATDGEALIPQEPILEAENSFRKLTVKNINRPISKLFYSFRNQTETRTDHNDGEITESSLAVDIMQEDVLYNSALNFSSLSTVGRVRLTWVDTITSHLHFNPVTRTLSIFRFPSFCVANILRANRMKTFESITTKLLSVTIPGDHTREADAVHREILLSYRVLFGQSAQSRKLVARHLLQLPTPVSPPQHASASSTHSTAHPGGASLSPSSNPSSNDIDPFLRAICTAPLYPRRGIRDFFLSVRRSGEQLAVPDAIFPPSNLDATGSQLQESNTYSALDDFPIYGRRLLSLQRYNHRQQPNKVREIWRDRRNPLQWYTFWAVLSGATVLCHTS
ncbi:hypothetical protein PG985_014936 [Apiospora marii]|uniref:RGS domain-containing protein n=1 Tax=Apiospora marii TaxID=335849 RepID=A0ABR1RIU6_9PEZI